MINKLTTVSLMTTLLFFATAQSMSDELIIVNEVKFSKIIDGKKRMNRFEASGVRLVNDRIYVVFDNDSRVARVNMKLTKAKLLGKAREKVGYEGISYDPAADVFYVVEESLQHQGEWHGRLSVMDEDLSSTQKRSWLGYAFESGNKGFEGLAFLQKNGTGYLLALCEGNGCRAGRKGRAGGGGTIQVFTQKNQAWKLVHTISLPKTLVFSDYSGLDISADNILAVSSQESSAIWIGKLDVNMWKTAGEGKVYTFPTDRKGDRLYCNVEGIAWIGKDRLVVVSDAKKKSQSGSCKKKEQSIHIVKF